MRTKGLTIKQMDDAGTGLALIAQLSAVDHDGDTYERGAFSWKGDKCDSVSSPGQWVKILPAHDRRALPLGKGFIYEEGDQALAKLFLNVDTQDGKDWYSALKFDLAQGKAIQEWSYGFQIVEADFQFRGEQRVQVLKKLDADEVSPVVRGAGQGTRTLEIKSAELKEKHFEPLIASLGELADALPADATAISATGLKQLEEIESAIGAVLQPLRELAAKEKSAVENAIAGFALHQARGHIRR